MKKLLLILLLAVTYTSAFSQNDIEELRQNGFDAKTDRNYKKAIVYYQKILKLLPNDYDAKLAIARLYYLKEDYKKSIKYFNEIYINDSTDVEALKGLGDNYLFLDKLDKAIEYYKKGIALLPNYFPIQLQLAKAYSWKGKLDEAIKTYKKILKAENTYAEAWQGIGKMYYWKEKPKSALQYYEKAIKLDTLNKSIQKEYEQIKQQLKFNTSATFKLLNETEDSYQIDASIQQYSFSKRLNDHFNYSLNFVFDHSDRDFTNKDDGDTIRWYDNTWAKIGWISEHNKLFVYSGYSINDSKFSSYGLNWKLNFKLKSFEFKNSFSAGYDYFYYWNKVGHNNAVNNLSVIFKKLKLNLNYGYGLVDAAYVSDVLNDIYDTLTNPHNEYSISVSYKILSKPKITIAANYSYLNYEYKSRLYYTPFGRNLIGPSANIYYAFKKFYFYGSYSYNIGTEYYFELIDSLSEKIYLNADNWSANLELGYSIKSFSTSISASRFYNNYYTNYLISFNLKYSF